MKLSFINLFLLSSYLFVIGAGWRAVPANKVVNEYFIGADPRGNLNIEFLPRRTLHSTYKFGYCPPEIIAHQFLRSTANITFENFRDSDVEYFYLIADFRSTTRFKRQCVVMKTFVPRRYLLWKPRIPIYYCQGQLFIMMLDTVHRLAVHEFYVHHRIKIPMDLKFEFYHPNIL